MTAGRTPSQTVGPYFAIGLPWPEGPFAVPRGTPGAILIHGRLLDGRGDPVPDGLIETWQVGPPGTRGFARSPTDRDGRYEVLTLKPTAIRAGGAVHAPHLVVSVFARGLLKRAVTRIYFADEPSANGHDPVLAGLADAAARATLVAAREESGYRFDIRLQGDRETVFFDV